MKDLRNIILWFPQHRLLGIIIFLGVLGGTYFAYDSHQKSAGLMSAPLKRSTIAETVYGIGTVVANQSWQVRPGQVSHIDIYFCKEGDVVKRGQALLTLDQIMIRAPFAGTVTRLPFKTGENVYAQGPVLTLTDLKDRYMTVSLEQQGALRVRAGQKVKISFDTLRESRYEGIVQSVYSNESSFLARIDVTKLPAHILPGMTADVAILVREKRNVLLVPVAALVGRKVWIKRGHEQPRLVEIKIGIVDQDVAEVLDGDLNEGDRVVIKGAQSK